MGSTITLANSVEPYEVIESFLEAVETLNEYMREGRPFVVLSKTDGKPLAFSIANLVAVEGAD